MAHLVGNSFGEELTCLERVSDAIPSSALWNSIRLKTLAQAAVNGLRMQVNEKRNRQREQSILVADLIDHYMKTELAPDTDWRSHATRIVYREFLIRWIKPHWGSINIREVRTVAVESWLRQLKRKDGQDLANSTKAKVRNLMSVLFNHAIRNEWLEQGKNPITLVRQSALAKIHTDGLGDSRDSESCYQSLRLLFESWCYLDVTTGLRRSELFALKWRDIDFWNLTIDIKRSIFQGVVGNCKTEASRSPVPLSLDVAADLWLWKENTAYATPDDWVFASPRVKGKSRDGRTPCWRKSFVRQRSCWNQEKDRLAYIPAHLFNNADCEW